MGASPTNESQVDREKLTIRRMIAIYCSGHRHFTSELCAECEDIRRYADQRIDMCPFNGAVKPVCGLCRANCFSADMFRQFGAIMRYAGPRMLLRHPVLTMAHFRDALRGKFPG